jgi:mannitol/fructose-specific phosphotransferase system IIA component (Ntr-type)
MHAVFGGFVMGLAIGDSKRLREHTRGILHEFVTSVFTPVFFATMALRFDFVAAFDLRLTALVLAIACIAKVFGCALGAWLGRVGKREAFAIGFGMNSRGAMEILLALLALEAKIISAQIFVALVVMAVVTSLISGPAMMRLLRPTPSPALTLLRTSPVVLDLDAATRETALQSLSSALADHLQRPQDSERFSAAVLAREELSGTGVGDGVAIPHAEVEGLTAPALLFCRTARELDFDAPDGEGVRLLFMLLVPPREFGRELQLLSAITRLVVQEDVRRELLSAKDTRAVLAVLEQADRVASGPAVRGKGAPDLSRG